MIGEIHYETVPDMIWSIDELTDVWGIGPRMAKRLNRLQIHNLYELAHANPYLIKQNLGVIGSQLFVTAWGIDRPSDDKIYIHLAGSATTSLIQRSSLSIS